MPVTNQAARAEVARRVGPYVIFADLDDAIAKAARDNGLAVAEIASATDAELAVLEASRVVSFADMAELRTLESILQNLDQQEMDRYGFNESLDAVARRLERIIARKWAYVKGAYSIGIATPEFGTIGLNFAQGAGNTADEWGS